LSFPRGDDAVIMLGQNFNILSRLNDVRHTDEHSRKTICYTIDREVGLEAIDLSAK
jgi:hypothetical protein